MLLKYMFLHCGTECNEMYRKIFVEQELALDEQQKIYKISDISEILLKCEDILDIKERRKENWNYIMKSLDNKKSYSVI